MKAKIIATYGPGMDSMETLRELLKYVNVIRINMSHGDEKQWAEFASKVRSVSRELGREIALFADLPGPKIRIGKLVDPIKMKKGEEIALAYSKYSSNTEIVPLDYDIHKDVKAGAEVLIGEYSLRLKVKRLDKGRIICEAMNDGEITSHKGIGIKGLSARVSPPTPEDLKRAEFAVKNGFDFLGISFVREASNIKRLRKYAGGLGIIAKIERKIAIDNIAEIAEEADALMVARGDLAFDVDIDMIPIEQRRIITAGRDAGKPVIVATQMLASMVNNAIPTRAEVNDIANAIASGADCLMLSDETAVGKFPVEAVKMLAQTASNAEQFAPHMNGFRVTSINGGIAFAASQLADNYHTDMIFAPTQSGTTPKILSTLRPVSPITALTGSEKVRKMLKLSYGVESMNLKQYKTTDQMFERVKEIAKKGGIKKYIIVSGSPNKKGTTDTLKYIEN